MEGDTQTLSPTYSMFASVTERENDGVCVSRPVPSHRIYNLVLATAAAATASASTSELRATRFYT